MNKITRAVLADMTDSLRQALANAIATLAQWVAPSKGGGPVPWK